MYSLFVFLAIIGAVVAAPAEQNEVKPAHTVDFNHYWPYDEIVDYLQDIEAEYPGFTEFESIGTTAEGRPIVGLKITNKNVGSNKPTILVEAGSSARDWLSTMSAIALIHEIVEHSYDYVNMLDNMEWMIIPTSNPDGYVYTHTTDRAWIKNRRVNAGSACVGVNTNRNFDHFWGQAGSSNDPCSNFYAGTAPESELETDALVHEIEKYGDRIKAFVSIQASGSRILYPFAHSGSAVVDNFPQLLQVASEMSRELFTTTSHFYTYGNSATIIGEQSGTSTDFAKSVNGSPLSYTFQVPAGGANGYDYDLVRLGGTVNEVIVGFLYLGNYVADFF